MPSKVMNVASDDAVTTIYRLNWDGEEVIAARVAERLDITQPTMSAMLRRLERDGLVSLDERKRIALTPRGTQRAEEMLRRHRLAECLLVDILGIEWWRAYEEAHLLEHAISPITEQLIRERLGEPSYSPFGYPIPGCLYTPEYSHRTVADLEAGERAVIERVFEEEQELLRYFDDAGLRPGAEIEVEAHSPAAGTVTLTLGDEDVIIGYPTARRVWVRQPDSPHPERVG